LPLEKKIVMYCGHLYEEKGIEHILLTARRMNQERIVFILVGGWESDVLKWKHYCEANNIDNVYFNGFVNNSTIPKYLKSSDVLIMPYKIDIDFQVMDVKFNITIEII